MVLLEYEEQAAVITALVEIEYSESAYSERIFWTTSCIGYILLWILGDDLKYAGNAALGESAYVEAVLGVYIGEDPVEKSG